MRNIEGAKMIYVCIRNAGKLPFDHNGFAIVVRIAELLDAADDVQETTLWLLHASRQELDEALR